MRIQISSKKIQALVKGLTFSLANDHSLTNDEQTQILKFITQVNGEVFVQQTLNKLTAYLNLKPVVLTDEDLMRREPFSPAEMAELYSPMPVTDEQLRVREAEQQVKRIMPPQEILDALAAESKPDIDGNDTQNRYTD